MTTTTVRPPLAETTQKSGMGMRLLVALATVLTIAINILASTLPLNNQNTGDISDSFDVFFVPSGYVFTIWGVIYIGWIAYTIYQLLPAQRDNATLKAIAPWYLLSAVANSAWLFAWHYLQFPISVAIILVLAISLIQIYRILAAAEPHSRGMWWAVSLPFSIYLAWASVATIANITATLSLSTQTPLGISALVWGEIMLAVAVLLGLAFSFVRADIGFVAVFIWAIVGIGVAQSDTAPILWTSLIGAVLLALSLLYTVPRRRRLAAQNAASA
ncbi:MAG: tryptophan-rich sensory protein [Caldilineaceae bacterium]